MLLTGNGHALLCCANTTQFKSEIKAESIKDFLIEFIESLPTVFSAFAECDQALNMLLILILCIIENRAAQVVSFIHSNACEFQVHDATPAISCMFV